MASGDTNKMSTDDIKRELWRPTDETESARVDTGPSMLTRARLMIAGAFLIVLPAIAVGLARTSETVDAAGAFAAAQSVFDAASRVENDIATTGLALVRFENEATLDRGRGLLRRLDRLSRSTITLQASSKAAFRFEPLAVEMKAWTYDQSNERLIGDPDRPLSTLVDAIGRARRAIDPQTKTVGSALDDEAVERAEVALLTADNFIRRYAALSLQLVRARAEAARQALARAGRDLLVTFIVLLFALTAFLMFGPAYILVPVQRLRGLATRIESGRIRDVSAHGFDEVADVSRSLQVALRRLEDNDQRKTRKILEMRKLLREVLAHTADAIVVVNTAGRVDYVNGPAAKLVGQEAHHVEQAPLSDVLFSPGLSDAVEHAREGDLPTSHIPVTIEAADGRVEKLMAELGVIRSSNGEVSRIIIVMRKPTPEAQS